jgi:xanthine/uracil permease
MPAVARPARRTIRTAFQAFVSFAAITPVIYQAATNHSPELATGAAAVGITIAGAVTRVMALPVVETFLQRFLPFLAAAPKAE